MVFSSDFRRERAQKATSKRYPPLFFLGFLLISIFGGCAGKDIEGNDPGRLFEEAETDFKNDKLILAAEKLKLVKNKFPYSSFAVEAQLKLADVYFAQESFAEAAATYEVFRDLHPKHPKVPYALYRIGKSYFSDAPSTVARDLTTVQKAVDAYNDYLKKFPGASEAEEVRKELAISRKMLADKELYIANFYFKRDEYPSAKKRYEKIVSDFPDSSASEEAKKKITELEPKLAQESK